MKEKLKAPIMRNATLKQLRVLAAIAKSGKITCAAKDLGVTPPAVSLQLKLLEKSAGMPLFDRSSQGLRPTDAGSYMLETQARIASALAECDEGLQQLKRLGRGRVSIGIVSTTKYFAPLALAAFSRENPSIELELLVAHRDEIIGALSSLKLDMAIMGRPPNTIELERQVIGDHPHVIIAAPDHPRANKSRVPLRSLFNDTFLLRESGSGTRILTDQMLAKTDLAPRFGMEFGSNKTIKQAVMAGLGVAFISAHTVAAKVAQGRMIVLSIKGLPVVKKWYVLRSKAKHLLPRGTALWEFLIKNGERFLPDVSALIGRSKTRVQCRTL